MDLNQQAAAHELMASLYLQLVGAQARAAQLEKRVAELEAAASKKAERAAARSAKAS